MLRSRNTGFWWLDRFSCISRQRLPNHVSFDVTNAEWQSNAMVSLKCAIKYSCTWLRVVDSSWPSVWDWRWCATHWIEVLLDMTQSNYLIYTIHIFFVGCLTPTDFINLHLLYYIHLSRHRTFCNNVWFHSFTLLS